MKEIHLLLVDKNLSYLEFVKKILKFHDDNFIIDVATSSEQCLDKLIDQTFDLVLLDYTIDGNKGLEVLNRIKRSGFAIPVVLMVDEDHEEIAFKALEHGAADYVMKVRGYLTALPFTIGKVLERQKLNNNNGSKTKITPAEHLIEEHIIEDSFADSEEAYYIIDRRGRVVSANKKLEIFSSYSEPELLELTLMDLLPKEDEVKFNQWLSALDLGYNTGGFKTELVGKFGDRKSVEVFLNPIRNQENEISSYKGKISLNNRHQQQRFTSADAFDQQKMIQEMVDIINSSYSGAMNHLLERITKTICQLFKFKRATLAILDRRRNVFVKQAMVGFFSNNNSAQPHLIEVPQNIIENNFTEKHRIKVLYADQHLRTQTDSLISTISDRRSHPRRPDNQWHPNDMIILNLVDKNEKSFGYISIDNPEVEYTPSREIFHNLELFGALASLAISNFYRFSTVEKSNRRLKQLLVTSNIFKLSLSMSEMLTEIVWSIKFSLDFNLVLLGLISRKSGKLEIKALACDDKIKALQIRELSFSLGSFQDLMKKQYRKGKSYFVHEEEAVLKDVKTIYYNASRRDQGARFWPWYASLLIPIRNKYHKIIGFIIVDDPADGLLPSSETIHTLEILATQISVAIDNRLLYLRLQDKPSNDKTKFAIEDIDTDGGFRKFVDKIFK